jgi:aarF domain-containing kinase
MYPDEGKITESAHMDMLLNVLPKESVADATGLQVARMIERISHKKVPVSSFSRMWTLGSLQAKVTLGYFAYWLRSHFADANAKEQLKNEAHTAAALQLFGAMGYLRGAVMKVGQLLANLPDVVPEEFADVLAALHFEAPPMHFSMIREVFLDEFGREPEEIFASFDRQAFAAASLGQVHRARLHSGEEVAVKIQYPGIARTIKADLRNLRILLQPMCLTKDWGNTLDKLDDIEQTLLTETDYEQEARFGTEVRLLFSEADRIVAPRVYGNYSTKRVLTTEFLRGCHLDGFLATNPGQEERDHFTTLMTVATRRVFYRLHWFTADPHPGNFIFMEDGRLGFIDFGCTRPMNDECWQLTNSILKFALERDETRLSRAIAKSCLYDDPDEMEADQLEVFRRWINWQTEPIEQGGLFDFRDREFFRRGIDCFAEMARKKYTRSLPIYLWSTRSILSGRALCYRLQGRCEFRKIDLQESAGRLPPVPSCW